MKSQQLGTILNKILYYIPQHTIIFKGWLSFKIQIAVISNKCQYLKQHPGH